MNDISTEIRDILVFHLGVREAQITYDARLADDLGADSLDIVEITMSCEERFGIPIPNRAVSGLKTVGDAIRLVTARLAAPAESAPPRKPLRLRFALPWLPSCP